MNKNPFVPQPTYSHQPPLPPGPPPAQPAQPDYSAYWAAAAAAAQPQPQPPTVTAYNPQQSALYANYGYGGQQALHWQQQRAGQPGQPYAQPPAPMVPPPPAQPAYNPYQPAAGYAQPYIPQPAPPPMTHYPPPPQQQMQQPPQAQFYPQHQQQQQPQQPRHNHSAHHTQSQHLPPAKRQRFDGPQNNNSNNQHHNNRGPAPPPPPQPQFQPPPPPPIGGYNQGQGQMQGHGRGGGPPGMQSGGGRGGSGGRGNSFNAGRGGRGGSMGGNRGGASGGRGGRGARGGNQGGGSLRGHGSRGGFNNNNYNRRGGSFNTGSDRGGHHQTNSGSFRGRGQGYSASNRGGRHDGGGATFGARDSSMNSSFSSGKKDENRRTLTDFKIIGLEIQDLGWTWGVVPSTNHPVKSEAKDDALPSGSVVKNETMETDVESAQTQPVDEASSIKIETDSTENALDDDHKKDPAATEAGPALPPPPSRVRIYFHTPVSPDDSHPIPHISGPIPGLNAVPSDSRKGKRKKLEDDDGDLEEGRGWRPPPQMSGHSDDGVVHSVDADGTGRGSAAPSIAETASVSEGDWLMAAIAEDEGDGDADEETLHISQVEESVAIGDHDERGDHIDDSMDVHGDIPQDEAGSHPSVPVGEHDVAMGPDGLNSVHGPKLSSDATFAEEDANTPLLVPHDGGQHKNAGPTTDQSQVDLARGNSSAASDTVTGASTSPSDARINLNVQSGNMSADHAQYTETQVSAPRVRGAPLQATDSIASTIPELETQVFTEGSPATVVNGSIEEPERPTVGEDMDTSTDQDHLPEPPISPDSNTLLSVSSASTYGDVPAKPDEKAGVRTPSANRLSISYAAGSRRLVIDSGVVEKLKVFRAEGRLEVYMTISREDQNGLKGVLIESLSEATKSYLPLSTPLESAEVDPTLPPFLKGDAPFTTTMVVHLDTERPLSEPKWVKTGDVQEWLKSIFGRMFWVAGDAADGWEKKIEVVDPDPAPTIWTVLEGWAVNSPDGLQTERQRFLKTHMTETDNILEILLRLVRGERATPFSQSNPAISAPSVSGPLLSALSQGSAHGAQQTHVSLAVLAMFRMTVEYAKKAVGEKGKGEVEERVGEIIRCLPSHLIYKSLEGIFKEWRVEKKGGR